MTGAGRRKACFIEVASLPIRERAKKPRSHPQKRPSGHVSKDEIGSFLQPRAREARADRFIVSLEGMAVTDGPRVGPKAANLAALAHAGLPTPGGFCLTADAYLAQVAALGLDDMVAQFAAADLREQRRLAVEIRLALYEQPIMPDVLEPLCDAWHAQRAASSKPCAVRSSALVEDRKGANFAGQFESFLGIDDEAALLTAVRACWAALWATTARRAMDSHGYCPADTAMAVLIQPLVDAHAS